MKCEFIPIPKDKRKTRKLDIKDRNNIKILRKKGLKITEIAKKYNVTPTTIYYSLLPEQKRKEKVRREYEQFLKKIKQDPVKKQQIREKQAKYYNNRYKTDPNYKKYQDCRHKQWVEDNKDYVRFYFKQYNS